jgi:hypothetical protein
LPKGLTDGWQVSGIYTGQSGLPITPFLSVDSSGTGELNDRPNLIGNPNSGPRRPNEWFNKAAFAQPLTGTFGNSARNLIIGPNLNTVDLSVNKLTKVTERASIQFRSEIFNAFNRANFSLPNVDFIPVRLVQSARPRMSLPEIHDSAKAVLGLFNSG